MKQITDIENIIKLLTEEPDMVPNPPGTEEESTTMELDDFQKLMGVKKGTLDPEVFDDDYYPKYTSIVYDIDDQYVYVDLEKGERGSTHPYEVFQMEDWDFDIMRDMVEDRWHHRDYEPFDCYNTNEEWVEGYAFTALSPKNVSLLADWFEVVAPQLAQRTKELLKKDPNLDNRDMHGDWQNIAVKMMDTALGGKLIEYVLDEYCAAINPAMINATAIDIRKEWETLKKKYGGGNWWDTDEIVTFQIPIEDMIYIYYKTNKYKSGDTIEEVIESMLEDIGSSFGNINEWWWEGNYYPEFVENYNHYVTPLLERQIEKIEDVDNLEEIKEINKKLDDYKIGMDQPIKPIGAPYEMIIQRFDPESLMFDVRVHPVKGYMKTGNDNNKLIDPVSGQEMGWYTYRQVRMTVDDIINKVVNPELKIDGTGYYFPAFEKDVIKEEKLEQQDREVEINKFIGFCKDELDINELPPVTLRYEKKGEEGNSDITTTAYQSKDQGVHVYVKERALVDILRSIAHELVHHHQLERDEEYYWKHIEDNPGIQSGTDLEDEANARAGSLIKDWGLVHGNNQIYEGRLIQEHRLYPPSFRDRMEDEEETILNVEVEVLHKYLNKRREELKEKFRPLLEEIKFLEYTIEEQVKDGEYENRGEWWEENTHPMGGSAYDEMSHELESVEEDLERVGILSDWRTGMNYDINEWLEDLIKEIDDDFYITENGMVELEYLNMGGGPLDEDLTNWAYDGEEIGPIKEDDPIDGQMGKNCRCSWNDHNYHPEDGSGTCVGKFCKGKWCHSHEDCGYKGEDILHHLSEEELNDLIYRKKPKEKHIKRMEKDWGELTGFPIEKFKNIYPPENESDETEEELKHLDSILVDDEFVHSADDVDQHFKSYLESKDLEYPIDLIKKYMPGVRSIILKLKYHYNRPRPGQVADAKGMDFDMKTLKSASTPSYPSGHATQGRFIGKLLGDVYPEHKEQLLKIGDDIAYSRNMAKVHYPSDSKIGQKLGDELYKHISKGVKLNEQIGRQDFECLCCCPPGLPGGNSTEVLGNPTMWDLGLTHPVINLQCVLGLNWDTHISMDGYNPTNPQEVQDYIDDNGVQIPSCEDCCQSTGGGCSEAPCPETEDDETGDNYYDYHDHDLEVDFGDHKPPKPTGLDPNYYYQKNKKRKLKEGKDFEPFTKAEVGVMNRIASKFSYDELKEISDNGEFTKVDLSKRYLSFVKLFGVNDDRQAQAMDYGRIWAKWIVDNWDNHIGNVVSPDFSSLIGKEGDGKAFLDEYEVEGEEDVWEKAFRQGSVYMYGFDDDSMYDYAGDYFYDYDPDMETVDWGDSDTEEFRIGDVNKLGTELRLNEQSIDISAIPKKDLSPELEVGDRVYGWDLRDDGDNKDYHHDVPNQILGNVVHIEQDNRFVTSKEQEDFKLDYIYYDIETIDGDNVALYPDDKYIKLPKKQLNEEEVVEDLETKVFRFIRPIDIEKALSQKEIQKVLKSLGLKYNMFDTLDINLENDMAQDLRNQIRFDNFYKRMIAASDIRGGTWEGLFAGLFNGKVVAGQKGVGKSDVETPEGGWSLKFVANKNESPTLGSLKTQLQQVKEEGLVPEDASIYSIFSTPDSQTSSELFEAKHQILDSAFEGVNFIAVAYPLPQQNTIIMHFTDMDNLKDFIIDTENPPINKPKSGPEALGELRLSSRGWKSFPFLQITFPEATQEKYQEYLKKYPREQEIEGVFGKYGEKIPPEVLQYLRKNPQTIINRLKNIPGYDKYFTEQFINSAEYLTQDANQRLKSFKKFLIEKCNMKDIPTTVGFRPREAWEDGLMDIFGRCWFKSTSKGIEGAFGELADKTFEIFPVEEFPNIKEKVDEIFNTSKQAYDYIFPPQGEETKYSLRNIEQEDAAEILYNDIKELVEEAEKVGDMVTNATEEEHLEYLEGIRNRIELILNIFTSSIGSPVKRRIGFLPRGK